MANQPAYNIVRQATGQIEKSKKPEKHPTAVTLGRLGGLKGGKARAEWSEIAKAAEKPWGKQSA